MNPILIVAGVGVGVVAAVPPLRGRAVAAAGATVNGAGRLTMALLAGTLGVGEAAAEGALGVADALIRGPRPATDPGRPVGV